MWCVNIHSLLVFSASHTMQNRARANVGWRPSVCRSVGISSWMFAGCLPVSDAGSSYASFLCTYHGVFRSLKNTALREPNVETHDQRFSVSYCRISQDCDRCHEHCRAVAISWGMNTIIATLWFRSFPSSSSSDTDELLSLVVTGQQARVDLVSSTSDRKRFRGC